MNVHVPRTGPWDSLTDAAKDSWRRSFARRYMVSRGIELPEGFLSQLGAALRKYRLEAEMVEIDKIKVIKTQAQMQARRRSKGSVTVPIETIPPEVLGDESRFPDELARWESLDGHEQDLLVWRLAIVELSEGKRTLPADLIERAKRAASQVSDRHEMPSPEPGDKS